ncbi:MAG: hypothetical protein KAS32_29855 [Candidatus Peribacteraceae bacterium]|nr:hypothetical protein [Candidatus Peribacteraceae bacterium]
MIDMSCSDVIEEGDCFNAYVKKGVHSKRLDGKEGVGQLACCCPEIAKDVNDYRIQTNLSNYRRDRFCFKKVRG